MRALVLLLLLVPAVLAVEECISCEEMQGTPPARILNILDSSNQTIEIIAYYENYSATPSRQYINDSIIIIHMTNATGLDQLYKTYTNAEGKAYFDFGSWKDGCANFKILYCPFCAPGSPACGFKACLDYAQINTTATSADDITAGPGGNPVPSPINPARYLATVDQASYCPPPPSLGETPGLCLPLLIIFSLLSGALYLTGRNPFAAFNIGGARIGRHIRYQARGRGFAMDLKAIAMSIRSAAGEMEAATDEKGNVVKDEKGNVVRKGSLSEPKWFLFSNIRDLGDVIGGTRGGVTEVRTADLKTVQLAGGRRARPGISKAFSEAGRQARGGYVRVFGAEQRDKEGKVTGREFGAGRVMSEWGTELLHGLGRIVATAWDSTWLSYLTTLNAGSALERSITGTERQTRAAFLADVEIMTDRYGRDVRDMGVRMRETTVDTDGSLTGRAGARYLDLGEITSADGTRGRAIVVELPAVGENGQWSATVSVVVGTGAERRVTNYSFENGRVSGVEQLMNVGTRNQVGMSFRVGEGGTVVASGLVTYGADGARSVMEVHRDAEGRIDRVGNNIVLQRNERGEVTGVFDSAQAGQRGQPGLALQQGNATYDAVNALINSDGRNINSIAGVFALNDANMRDLTRNTMNTLNSQCERTRQVYMDQFGLVQVAESSLLGTMDENGRVRAPDAGSYDANIRVVDSSYTPSGESRERGLAAGTTITVQDGQYQRVTGANGADIPLTTRTIQGDVVETRIGNTSVVLNSGYRENRDAGGVREHMGGVSEAAANVMQSYYSYQPHLQESAGRAFLDANPAVREAMTAVAQQRAQATERFEAALDARGVSGGTREAATALFSSVTLGGQELRLSGEIELAERQFQRASARGAEGIAGLSLRGQAYAAVLLSGVPPDSPEGQRLMQPRLEEIGRREYAALQQANSPDPATRAQGEQALRDMGYRPREGQSMVDTVVAYRVRADEVGQRLVIQERVDAQVGAAMAGRPGLLVPGSVLGDPESGPLASKAATAVLGLGTSLIGMPEAEVRERIAQRVAAEPSIRPEDRQRVVEMATEYIPRATEVARDYSEAARVVTSEVSSRTYVYAPHDADMALARAAGSMTVGPGGPPPEGSDEQRRILAQGNQFLLDASRTLTRLGPDASAEDQNRAMGGLLMNYASQYAAQLTPQPMPQAGTPQAQDFQQRSGVAIDSPDAASRWAAAEQQRILEASRTPPYGMSDVQAFLALAAGGPNMNQAEALARGGMQTVSMGPVDPAHPPQPVASLNPAAVTGFVVSTDAAVAAAREQGWRMPDEVFQSGIRGMAAYHRGDDAYAQQELTRTAVLTSVFSDERVRDEERYREMRRYGGEDVGPSDEFMERYRAARRSAREATGIDIGEYSRTPRAPSPPPAEGRQPRGST
ncbi:MAG: hypothetical protein AB1529_03690 [Candidatus Micrarchaeota archaeon]